MVAQDHRWIKRLARPGLGCKRFLTARRTSAGYEILAMLRNGQTAAIPANDMPAQATSIAPYPAWPPDDAAPAALRTRLCNKAGWSSTS